jgi:carboxypeptidase Q
MRRTLASVLLAVAVSSSLAAQTLPTSDPMLARIWAQGMDSSQTYRLMQTLTDSIGPRLTGSPGMNAGEDWLVSMYTKWGIVSRKEQYGTWLGWRRGIAHVDLISPRVRSLEAALLAWSGGTKGKPSEGSTVLLPDLADSAAYEAWYAAAKGKFVLISPAEPTCRPDSSYKRYALPETFTKMTKERNDAKLAWQARVTRTGYSGRDLPRRLEAAGARGVVTSYWSQGWGVQKLFQGRTITIPTLDLSCEDYGLVFRLTENEQAPVLRVTADAEFQGDVPVFNVIGEIRGSEKPDEYVVLSAHFDSWDGSSGATDNGTGTITMLEAMRILKTVYPNPRRTILVGHWGGEEQGLNGSRAFAEDHPEVVGGLQALFNQDNGTGRVTSVGAAGIIGASPYLAKWFARMPTEITGKVTLGFPGGPAGGGTDNASFACFVTPAFGLGSLDWEYGTYTWHTNRDTFDKVVFDEIRNNATMTAMLAYQASEEPDKLPRDARVMGPGRDGRQQTWPECVKAVRSFGESKR